MKTNRPILLPSTDADVAMAVVLRQLAAQASLPDMVTRFYLEGLHERTSSGDELLLSFRRKQKKSQLRFRLKRDSLYHILPEYLFHPLDRYAGCEGDQEEFEKRYQEQKRTEKKALAYFLPYDTVFQQLRIRFQDYLDNHILNDNTFLADFVTKGFSIAKENDYIRVAYRFIPWMRHYRGNLQVLRIILTLTLGNETVISQINGLPKKTKISAACHTTLDGTLSDLYCGEEYPDELYLIHLQLSRPILSRRQIAEEENKLAQFTDFFQAWFLAVEQTLLIEFGDRRQRPILASGYRNELFLNYNTQLI